MKALRQCKQCHCWFQHLKRSRRCINCERDKAISGTPLGGRKAAATNKQRHGEDMYRRIGAIGGRLSRGGGFGSDAVGPDGLTGRERSRIAGAKGGKNSRRS